MTGRSVVAISSPTRIDGVVPGVRGQRAFPVPAQGILDPFVMLDHIGPEIVGPDHFVQGHPHPHRGFETLTMMFAGRMDHIDSTGFTEVLLSGSTQNMVAGRGIQHGGDMAADPETGEFHEVQLWVNMPAAHKMDEPRISSAHRGQKPVVDVDGARVEVMTGSLLGATGPLVTTQPTSTAHIAGAGATVTLPDLPERWTAAFYVLRGQIQVEDRLVEAEHLAVLGPGTAATLVLSGDGAEVLFIAGEPIGEPVVVGGPYVMNTHEEIARAEADYRSGAMGTVARR